MSADPGFRWNLLALSTVRRLLRSAWFPVAIQAAVLAAALALLVNGWGIGVHEPTQRLLVLRKTNLTSLSIWGLWWPTMIIVAIAFGRAWCTVCPLELGERVGGAAARALRIRRLSLPRWMRSGWTVVAAYLFLQVLVAGVSIHRVPHYASVVILVLVSMSFVAGVVFVEPRSFCSGLCPARPLLSVYGRFTPFQLDVVDPAVCSGCRSRECVRAARRGRFDARSCPSFLRPFARRQGDGCLVCFQCAKACPQANVGWGISSAKSASRAARVLSPYEAGFVLMAAGFVTHELVGEVPWLEGWFHRVPDALHRLVPGWSAGWVEAAWFLVLFPAMLWSCAAVASAAWHPNRRVRDRLLAIATGAAPLVAVAHAAKAVAKLAGWAVYLPLSMRDPAGLDTLARIVEKTQAVPAPVLGLPTVGWLMGALLLIVASRSLLWAREPAPEDLTSARLGFGAAAVLFTAVMGVWAVG